MHDSPWIDTSLWSFCWLYFLVKGRFLWDGNGVESRIQFKNSSLLVHSGTCGHFWQDEDGMLSENQYLDTPTLKAVPVLICITTTVLWLIIYLRTVLHRRKMIFIPCWQELRARQANMLVVVCYVQTVHVWICKWSISYKNIRCQLYKSVVGPNEA